MSGDEGGNRISVEALTGECSAVQVREQNPTSQPSIRAATSVDTKYSKLLGNKGGNRKLAFHRPNYSRSAIRSKFTELIDSWQEQSSDSLGIEILPRSYMSSSVVNGRSGVIQESV